MYINQTLPAGNYIYPSDSIWNVEKTNATLFPVHAQSAAWLSAMTAAASPDTVHLFILTGRMFYVINGSVTKQNLVIKSPHASVVRYTDGPCIGPLICNFPIPDNYRPETTTGSDRVGNLLILKTTSFTKFIMYTNN